MIKCHVFAMLSVAAVPCSTFLINIYTWEGACISVDQGET